MAIFGLLCSVGCAKPGGEATLTKLDGGQGFRQTFSQAYASRSDQGDWDIVLVHDGLQDAARQKQAGGDAIAVADRVPVQHVVHLHVFWRPNRSVRSDDPSQSNAAVDWYVIIPGAREGEDLLKYKGAGFVGVYPGDKQALVLLRNIRLQREILRGEMTDPLSQARLTGEVRAVLDDRYVRNALDELQRLETSTTAAVTEEGQR